MLDALSVGIPMVLIPIADDQPENAQRCKELGVARVVEPDQHTGPALSQAIRDTTQEVLVGAQYREAAQRLRKDIEDLPGLEHAVGLLERLATERKPLLASH
ncbi:MAG: hypothetical protein M3328_09000 [Chloroflexota bacterium]|nr:hypothetical protein [Chloroflexota bacterium]